LLFIKETDLKVQYTSLFAGSGGLSHGLGKKTIIAPFLSFRLQANEIQNLLAG